MNKVPVQKVTPALIAPFPLLVLIVTCLVGDQQPFAFPTNASQGIDVWGSDTWADAVAVERAQTKPSNNRTIVLFLKSFRQLFHHGYGGNHTASNGIDG